MLEWRSVCQKEMDQCWNNLAEKIEEDVLDKYKVDDSNSSLPRQRLLVGMEVCAKKKEVQNTKSGEKIVGQGFSLCSRNFTCSVGEACKKTRLKEKR